MKKKIFCSYFQKYKTKLEFPPYPGKLGKKIYHEISKKAWEKWILQQTIIINEKKLNMLNINDRQILETYMKNFLFKTK
ncbi:MAG: oxidative damage protection protein [Buchnera aphidicola (Chaetogeoica yunlongensis)]